mmetsp:Transcript_109119/g.304163  ORF Transcript_109119/g.304163 Transcript_109119/m.304163 type:complete len:274 (-) Transcript_109119:725-1546(-)
MGANRGADDVVRRADVGDPVPHRLVDRVLERPRAALRGHDLSAHHLHAEDVQRLALHVHRAHVDDALEAQERAGRGAGDAMLARTSLGDHPRLAEALGEQRLAQSVVDLVRAGVGELLALEPQLGAPQLRRQPLRVVDWRGAADVLRAEAPELRLELRVPLCGLPSLAEFLVCLHERLRDVAPAILSKVPLALLRGLRTAICALPLGRRMGSRQGGCFCKWAARELLHQALHFGKAPSTAKGLDDLGTHDDAVGILADLLHVRAGRDAKAHSE